jgi:hypothetical protein
MVREEKKWSGKKTLCILVDVNGAIPMDRLRWIQAELRGCEFELLRLTGTTRTLMSGVGEKMVTWDAVVDFFENFRTLVGKIEVDDDTRRDISSRLWKIKIEFACEEDGSEVIIVTYSSNDWGGEMPMAIYISYNEHEKTITKQSWLLFDEPVSDWNSERVISNISDLSEEVVAVFLSSGDDDQHAKEWADLFVGAFFQ